MERSFDPNAADWNQAMAYMMRIDNLLQLANSSSISDDFDNWYDSLEALRRELAPRMTDKELDETKDLLFKARNFIKITNANKKLGSSVWVLRDVLNDGEIALRRVIRARNMDLPQSKDPSKALRQDRGF